MKIKLISSEDLIKVIEEHTKLKIKREVIEEISQHVRLDNKYQDIF